MFYRLKYLCAKMVIFGFFINLFFGRKKELSKEDIKRSNNRIFSAKNSIKTDLDRLYVASEQVRTRYHHYIKALTKEEKKKIYNITDTIYAIKRKIIHAKNKL